MHGRQIEDWWISLRDATRSALASHPRDPIPAYLVAEVVRQGMRCTGVYWPDSYPPERRFLLPDEVADWISDHLAP